jgi:hypothetical protein
MVRRILPASSKTLRVRMRRAAICLLVLLSCAGTCPSNAQGPGLPPHAWLFGSWVGGLYPPPVTLSAEECLAQPVVIFTRDVVLRSTFTDVSYTQRAIETVRATASGAEFRLVPPTPQASEGGTLFPQPGTTQVVGFGCETPNVLHVQRHGENQISFPHCTEFPYPLIRCPAH